MAKEEKNAPPAGTGNAAGLGEAFSINLSTGQGTYTYQMPLPDGVAKHMPKLALEYAHGAGHGAWGLGWRMGLRSISRRLDFGTPDESLIERFMDGGNELMPSVDGTFRAMRETAFSRYRRRGDGWVIEDRNGQVHELGLTPAGRVAHPDHPDRVVEWLLERSLDVSGNAIQYTYLFDSGMAYPQTIRYAIYEVRFTYEARSDVRHDGRAGFSRRRALRCARVELMLDPGRPAERVIRSWSVAYTTAPGSGVSLLADIRLVTHGTAPDGAQDVPRPPIRFAYSDFNPTDLSVKWMTSDDGPPPGLLEPDVALVTLDNAPLPGILLNRNGREYYWANKGNGQWAAPRPLREAPLATSFSRSGLAFVDMDGSGTADLMVAEPDSLPGYYENEGRDGWQNFVAFPRGNRSTPTWTDQNLQLLDADGDGLVDALTSQARAFVWWRNAGRQGWDEPLLIPKQTPDLLDIDLGDPDVHLADMTGDGLPDIVRVQSGRVEYWPNLGRGRFGERVQMTHAPRLRRSNPDDTLLLTDLDGDGCAELVLITSEGLTICQNQNGNRFADPVLITTIPTPMPGTVRAVNLTGRAGTGLIWNSFTRSSPAYVHVEFAASQPPYLLTRIENGAGLISELQYRSAIDDYLRDREEGVTWQTNFPFPYLVVGHTRETDTVSGRVVETDMKYHEAHFERHTRQFQGFRRTERIERGDSSRPDTLQVHQFLMAEEKQPGNGPEQAALNGLMSRIETFGLDGSALQDRPYRIETAEHDLRVLETTPDGRTRSFVFVTVHRAEDMERTDDRRVEEKVYTYDAGGNVVREVLRGSGVRGGVAQTVRERTTEMQYAVSATHYLLDKPARITVRDINGQLLTEKRIFYDGPDFIGLPAGQVDRGLPSREEEWLMTQAAFNAHYAGMNGASLGYTPALNADGVASVFAVPQRSRYDARGLALATRDPLGTESRYTYDADGLFRTGLTDPFGQTTFAYDRATGQVEQTTYADGNVTLFAYDAQGRVLRSAQPGQTLATSPTVYEYNETVVPNQRIARFMQADGTTSLGITYFDGYGKEFQQRVDVEPGKVIVSGVKRLNPWGDLAEEFEPTFDVTTDFSTPDTADRPSRRFFYDARGRAVRSINYNGGISTLLIEPFRVVTRDANDTDDSIANIGRGQSDTPHEEEFDTLRYLLRVVERVSNVKTVETTYETGPMGELLTVSDRRGVKFRYRYDRRGNRIAIVLRESGERTIWYDARKKPIRTRDGAGHDLRATFDSLGRLHQLAEGANVLEAYQYDTLAQNAFGRLAGVSYPGGRQDFTYDPAGRLLQRAFHYDGEANPQTLRYEYDPLGRLTACIHTDGTRIERQLMANGWLKAIPGAIQQVDYDPRGLPTAVQYQNNVRTTYDYTSGPGRISRQTTTAPGNVVLEAIEYRFDRLEVLLSSNDTAPGGAGLRQYSYDPLYQLTSTTNTENGNPVRRVYDYADDYNLQRFEEGRSTFQYDGAHPDRIAGVTPDGGIRFDTSFDAGGNLLALPGQAFTYNAKNELLQFSRADGLTAEYRYDHLGLRISKRVDDGQGQVDRTLYVGDEAEIRDGSPAYFVRVRSVRVAVITGGTTHFLHENSTGSTAFVTDTTGQRVGQVDTSPFGNVASQSGSVPFRTFSLHPVDEESGLVYMRRRYYSPKLGRFLTPDLMAIYQPEKFLHAPQGLHLYSYVANDPLNKNDPTGLSFWSFVGGVVGVIVGVVIAVALVVAIAATGGLAGVLLLVGAALLSSLAVTGISYIIASNVDPSSGFGQFMRGFMIGFNAGMNAVLATALFGPVIGITLGVINFLAVFDGIAKNSVYQGILGWTSWLMPMSWGVTGLGLVFYAVNLVVAGVTFQQWDAAKIEKLGFDVKTGTFVMSGGLIRNPTAFDMGHFVFMNPNYVNGSTPDRTYDAILAHETGHTLEAAAFGSAFLLADLIGENLTSAGANDYGEEIAESHANRGGRSTIPMWG